MPNWEIVRTEIESDLEFVDDILDKYFRNEYPEYRQIAYSLILDFVLKLSLKELQP